MTIRPWHIVYLLWTPVVVGCAPVAPAGPRDGGASGTSLDPEPVTFHKDVRPLLERSCSGCHRADALAPFSLQTHAQARAAGGLLRLRIEDGTMPPWGALHGEGCSPAVSPSGAELEWLSDPRPAPGAAEVLALWEEADYPEGDPADAPPPPALPDPLTAYLQLQPKVPFSVGGPADLHHCFVLEPGPEGAPLFVHELEVVPGLPRSVHAAAVYVDAAGASALLAGPDGDYPCFGDARLEGVSPVAIWMSGDPPVRFPEGAAFEVPAAARLVLQIHYHPGGQPDALDSTALRLGLSSAPPTHLVEPLRIGSPEPFDATGNGLLAGPSDPPTGPVLLVPAGAHAHAETVARLLGPEDIPGEVHVLGVAAHMHQAGTSITVDVERDASGPCLLHVPTHRFDWERAYRFDAPLEALPTLVAGDRVRVRCSFDNTLDNLELAPLVLASPGAAPTDLVWGTDPLTEVCAATVLIARQAP